MRKFHQQIEVTSLATVIHARAEQPYASLLAKKLVDSINDDLFLLSGNSHGNKFSTWSSPGDPAYTQRPPPARPTISRTPP